MNEDLKHYGIPRRSGRYPWGSGKNPQRSKDFLSYVRELEKKGLKETEIAEGLGLTTTQLRAKKSMAVAEKRREDAAMALRLKDKGYSNVAIGKRMGINESSVRSLLDPVLQERADIAKNTSDVIRKIVDEKQFLDVGLGVERHLGVSRTKMDVALAMLEEEGYKVHYLKIPQVGSNKHTWMKVLAPPGVPYQEVYDNRYNVKLPFEFYSEDGGKSFLGLETPRNVSRDKIYVRYNEDGGADKDGVIEIRPGVDYLSLGGKKYAQVRIAVEGGRFMKGMAMYSDEIPDGVDIVYNTNKRRGASDDDVFKPMGDDPDNPFGSLIRQKHYLDANGKKQLSALNVVGYVEGAGEEGSWRRWAKTISSQVLSKQLPSVAKKQLDLAYDLREEEFNELMSLTNPAVKKQLLNTFADTCDSAAVHLKAAALPRQANAVLLPITSMKDNEVYAPNFRNGETVVLIRHPHGGIFEIPELVVNNRNPQAKKLLGRALDAVGINPKVAARLSGADFDGDTVLVIPNKDRNIRTSEPLKELMDFDPKEAYRLPDDAPRMKSHTKEIKMGDISNLITDMTIRGASQDEIARAVRHSMVVIDAEKHHLDYKQSYIDNNIADLKKKYQGSAKAGASTLISRASSEMRVPDRKELGPDPETGEKRYRYTGETYVNKNGKVVRRTISSTKMAETKDAFSLSSGTVMEAVYADYANKLKALANKARKAALETKPIPYSPSAKKTYEKVVEDLKSQLNLVMRNKPRERQAQLLANKVVAAKRKANPSLEEKELKKIKTQALQEARNRSGAKKESIKITDIAWEAIQAGAISNNLLSQILLNTDTTVLKQRALPRTYTTMSSARIARARSMADLGYTTSEIADALGVSISTLEDVID